ncbi:hypothetical protein AURDEDRAFT_170510 [Auricularia subglabra TFB-10046 SS5]|nr:hypothetical protein AURDEDRAFT_170510 [Auricularia subglabra TFB-10046 SS5]
MEELVISLRNDLESWRDEETDEVEWVGFTITAIKLQCKGHPVSDLQERMQHALDVSSHVARVADDGRREACQREGPSCMAPGRVGQSLQAIEKDALHIVGSLKEIMMLYELDRDALSAAYAGQFLQWQKTYRTED